MSIEGIKSGIAKYAQIEQLTKPAQRPESGEAGESVSFSRVFSNAINEVDSLQKQADVKIQDLTLRKDDTTAHEAMIALEKADVAFQLMSNIRAKIIRAYEDIMRTQV